MKLKTIFYCGMLAAAMTSGHANAFEAIDVTSPGLTYSGAPYTLGFQFSVASNVSITALGAYDNGNNGLNGAASVGLWDSSGNLLVSTAVPAGAAGLLIGDFSYATISPYALTANTHYFIGAYEPSDLATSLNTGQGGSGSINPLVTIYQDQFSSFNYAFSFPGSTNSHPEGAWLGANFSTGVPEPATWATMLAGFAGLGFLGYRRNKAATFTA
jgi:hypothetical protein